MWIASDKSSGIYLIKRGKNGEKYSELIFSFCNWYYKSDVKIMSINKRKIHSVLIYINNNTYIK